MPLCLARQRPEGYALVCLVLVFLSPLALAQKIDSVTVLHSDSLRAADNQTFIVTFIVQINGTGLNTPNLQPVVFPAGTVTELAQVGTPTATMLRIQFNAPPSYSLEEVALLAPGASPTVYKVGQGACDFQSKLQRTFSVVNNTQTKNKYGNGIAKNFHVIQISLVNECTQSVVVPLAGIRLLPQPVAISSISRSANVVTVTTVSANPFQTGEAITIAGVTDNSYNGQFRGITVTSRTTFTYPQSGSDSASTGGTAAVPDAEPTGSIVPFSLDHVTSIYSTDRKLTGTRAIFFNSLQAAAAVGSAIEVFFGHGFTQGVSILGGGFTTAAQDVFKDMSTDQLQNLTSQSFGSAEQVAANGGPLQKFIFVRKAKKNQVVQGGISDDDLKNGNFRLVLEVIPLPSQTTAATVKASPSPQ